MSRPLLEVADLIRSAGTAFIERNRPWLRWQHIKVLRAIRRCRTAPHWAVISMSAPVAGIVLPSLITAAVIGIAKVSDGGPGTLDRCTSKRTSPDPLRPCRFHAPTQVGTTGLAEQKGPLRSAVSRQRTLN